MTDGATYTIGEMVTKGQVSIRTLRYYDQIDLLKPTAHTEGGHRLYSDTDLNRLYAIQSMKGIGLSLKEIKDILASGHLMGHEVHRSLQFQRKMLTAKKQTIEDMIADVDHMLRITEADHEIDIDIFCSMLHYITAKESIKEWQQALQIHTGSDSDETLEKEWSILLSNLKRVIRMNISPRAPEVQQLVNQLLTLMDRTAGDRTTIALPQTAPPIIAPFSEKDQLYLKEAIKIHKENKN
ncbi:MerR family transcriptional regulator [Terribacillus sp. 179-K 1B1 HS]|uniref:MerR family transcriptional regulator n=1 Tax=Terribacillus sp. 179-K 1B1 HS TaxID=3142388 RepID=UPI0039A380F9